MQNVERKEKSENPPQLYDLTTLQRDANRLLGFTAQQTLNYAQSLYEKRFITYPRTDSRFLTEDMAASLPGLVTDTGKADRSAFTTLAVGSSAWWSVTLLPLITCCT